jgi:chemotaxis protein CheD
MRLVTVEISDFKVSADPDVELVTYALGSCIAVIVHDPVRVAGGMIHYMLPNSSTSPEKAAAQPAMFADTGVPLLFEAMYGLGCKKESLVVSVAGGAARSNDTGDVFAIGKRNYTMLRKMFWRNGVIIAAEDVGGSAPRTARLTVGSGRVLLRVGMGELELRPQALL